MRRIILLLVLLLPCNVSAGIYYSGDQLQPLPAQWRGFLPDVRLIRNAAIATDTVRNPLRDRYADAALQLEATKKQKALTADEAADLGALYVRLGTPAKAIELLQPVARQNPEHFRVLANLGTAWQMEGEYRQAQDYLSEAVKLAPESLRDAEALHLKLVRARAKEKKGTLSLDDLFGVKFVGDSGLPEAGTISPAELKKLPTNALALVQQLVIWFPQDVRLLWLLAEVANLHGDVRTAANILDGCIGEFRFNSEDARNRRTIYRQAVEALEKKGHDTKNGKFAFASPRVFLRLLDEAKLPKIDPEGVNRLPWLALGETTIGKKFDLTFLKYVEELEGKTVLLLGHMVPSNGDDLDEFLFIENPVGCWFCESPGPTQVVLVKLKAGKRTEHLRGVREVEGKLKLNRTDPEGHIFILEESELKVVD